MHKLQARLGPIEGIEEKLRRLQDSSGQCKVGFTADGGCDGYNSPHEACPASDVAAVVKLSQNKTKAEPLHLAKRKGRN